MIEKLKVFYWRAIGRYQERKFFKSLDRVNKGLGEEIFKAAMAEAVYKFEEEGDAANN